MIAHTFDGSVQLPYDLIGCYKVVRDDYPDKALQIQKAAELYMLLFRIEDRDEGDFEMMCYFESLPEHDRIREGMRQDIISAINGKQ